MTIMLNRVPSTIHREAKGLRTYSQGEVVSMPGRVARFPKVDFRAPGLTVRGFFVAFKKTVVAIVPLAATQASEGHSRDTHGDFR